MKVRTSIVGRAIEQARATRGPVVLRDGQQLVLAWLDGTKPQCEGVECTSVGEARAAVALFELLAYPSDHRARLQTALEHARAAPYAAARRCSRHRRAAA